MVFKLYRLFKKVFNRWKGKHSLQDDAHKKVGARSCSSLRLLFGMFFGLTRIVMMQRLS